MRSSLPAEEITARIEAALYSAGRPLSIEELVRASGTNSKSNTRKGVTELIKKTKSVFTAIEITELADGTFVLQLKAIQVFYRDFDLKKYPNFTVGTEGTSYKVQRYYDVHSTPYIALYDKSGKLIKAWEKAPPVDELVDEVKKI